MQQSNVSIIVLNWNGGEDTIECLKSLKRINYPGVHIIVVDNCSQDNSIARIRKEFPEIIIIENKENKGFGGGNNAGIKYILEKDKETAYIFLLNQDTIVDPECVAELIKVSSLEKRIGIIGPKIYSKQKPNQIWSAGGEVGCGSFFKNKVSYLCPYLIGAAEEDVGQYDKVREVNHIPGTAMFIKRDVVLRIGLFDESFFLIIDETDYCYRARKAGYKIYFAPHAKIWHVGGASMEKGYKRGEPVPAKIYYSYRNWFFLLKKHFGLRVFSKVFAAHLLKIFPNEIKALLKRRWDQKQKEAMSAYFYVLWDTLRWKIPKRYFE